MNSGHHVFAITNQASHNFSDDPTFLDIKAVSDTDTLLSGSVYGSITAFNLQP